MTSRERSNFATLMALVVVVAIGRLMWQTADPPAPAPSGFTNTATVCVTDPDTQIIPALWPRVVEQR